MRKKTLFYPVLAALVLAGCSNDEPGITPEEPNAVFEGDEAYITVCLADAGSGQSRATTENPGYEYGSTAEHNVSNAYFYFYDANGVFVAEGSAWNEEENPATTGSNIEFAGKNVVALKGLTKKNYPKYMVTVLNRPSSFEYGKTLDEMKTVLLSGGIKDSNEKFVMSTTSWGGQKNAEDKDMKYFVTEVKESNFSPEPIKDANSTNYVTVYVERLAAKVTLGVSDNIENATKINGETYYMIKASVAGEGNDADINPDDNQIAAEDNDADINTDGNQIAAENLYVKLHGWKLNATAKNSYIVKNLDENWTNETLGFSWNKPSDFRSFWGKSFNYGKGDYPTSAGDLYDDEELVQNEYLTYVNLKTDLTELGESAYCAENTNTSDIVTNNFPSAVTSILLKAGVCNMDGEPLDLIRFNGLLFTQKTFPQYILNVMNAKGDLNVWYDSTPDETDGTKKQYKQIDENYVTLVHVVDGEANVQLKETGNPDLYIRTTKTVEGKDVPEFTKMNDSDLANVNTRMAAESGDAIGYKGGLMYYNIPIEHLNNSVVVDNQIPEAKYGVVRNHHYVVTVNKLESVGHGIFDPDEDEVIVPGGGPEDKTYYVGTNINILSWKIVNQNVDL